MKKIEGREYGKNIYEKILIRMILLKKYSDVSIGEYFQEYFLLSSLVLLC